MFCPLPEAEQPGGSEEDGAVAEYSAGVAGCQLELLGNGGLAVPFAARELSAAALSYQLKLLICKT